MALSYKSLYLPHRLSLLTGARRDRQIINAWNPATDCVPPPAKIHMLKPNPQCDGIWRWGLWEVIRL